MSQKAKIKSISVNPTCTEISSVAPTPIIIKTSKTQ